MVHTLGGRIYFIYRILFKLLFTPPYGHSPLKPHTSFFPFYSLPARLGQGLGLDLIVHSPYRALKGYLEASARARGEEEGGVQRASRGEVWEGSVELANHPKG